MTLTPIAPIAGPVAVLKFSYLIADTLTAVVQPAMNWKLNIDGKLVDVSNFLSGRTPALTLTDVDFECTLVYDDNNPPTDTDLANIRPGTLLVVQCYTNATKFYSLSAMVSTIAPGIESLEDVHKIPVTAKISGALTWPVILA
jgi:hypothetical protein